MVILEDGGSKHGFGRVDGWPTLSSWDDQLSAAWARVPIIFQSLLYILFKKRISLQSWPSSNMVTASITAKSNNLLSSPYLLHKNSMLQYSNHLFVNSLKFLWALLFWLQGSILLLLLFWGHTLWQSRVTPGWAQKSLLAGIGNHVGCWDLTHLSWIGCMQGKRGTTVLPF